MKLFQQLLVAPAALGLLAPLAANAAEVNINDVSKYTNLGTQELSKAQFSDIVPGDWAYSALQNLSQSYGCVDNAYTQSLNSGQALTRYEAAALINACLDGGIASAELSEDAIRLTNEFGTEMAILKGRVDGLEYKVQELSAGQFSSATKLSGQAVFTISTIDEATDTTDNKLAFNYAYEANLNTSFNGTDLLTVGLEAGNADDAEYRLDSAYASGNDLEVASAFHSFPIKDDFQVTWGPLLDQDDVISANTSAYSGTFRLESMPWGTEGEGPGPGAAVAWSNDSGFNASFSSVTTNGQDAQSGIWTAEGTDVYTGSLGYDADGWGAGLIYKNDDTDSSFGGGVYFTPDGFPTISVAYDTQTDRDDDDDSDLMIGLEYPVGPGTASAAYQARDTAGVDTTNWELYYNYPVTDGISVQGGMFVEGVNNADDTVGYAVETFFSF